MSEEAAARTADGRPLILLREVERHYRVGGSLVRALDGVDLEIHAGESVAVTGPSGSGKSTLMNVVGCLDSPTRGSYRLRGRDVHGLADDDLARIRNREIGFVFQTFNLLPRLDALANVALPLLYRGMARAAREEAARAALRRVGLGDRIRHRPGELSGGQSQRVAIARALVAEPAVLLADEPTGNLDSDSSREILELFARLEGEGHTVIVVTHDPEVAARAGRAIALRDGRIVDDRRL